MVNTEQFIEELNQDFAVDRQEQALICASDGRPIGTVFSHGYNAEDSYVYITVYVNDVQRHRGTGAEAFAIFIKYLFDRYGLYKIYIEVYSYNKSVISQVVRVGFVQEGYLCGHRAKEKDRYDLLILAIYRETLEENPIFRRILQRLSR